MKKEKDEKELLKELDELAEKMKPMVEKIKKQKEEIMNKDIMLMTKKELMNLENFYKGDKFNAFVIVPMNYKHDSGYQCMKYILLDKFDIVGVIGGGSDVIHFNGIGGYGKNPDYVKRLVKAHDIRIDCLSKSKCIRVFSDEYMELRDGFCGSDFIFYFKEN